MDKQILVLIAVVILAVLAGVQAVQINDLKENIVSGGVYSNPVARGNIQAARPAQQQPAMVGGC